MEIERVTVVESDRLFNSWIDSEFIPEGEDKYYLRDRQTKRPEGGWRHLTKEELSVLEYYRNSALDWDSVLVCDPFDPSRIRRNKFYGTVRIGRVSSDGLQFHDLRLPIGITNSSIHSCDIGDDCAIHNVHYLSHYIVGDRTMLFNIQEMCATDHAKFGNGVVKDGEDPAVRVCLHVMNESEARKVYPFDGMIAADAYLEAKYVDDKTLQERLLAITQASVDNRRGYYGTVGEGCVIKNSSIIKDVKVGDNCYIKGASKLKNITINSSYEEPSQIGENVILVNGIMGYGCRVFYGCIAVKFILGNNCNLKYGARLIDSILGDNSTISCCEVLNNLVFPCHEQHHNNSFLIASLVMGQSNMAAGATIGSNHNSRSNDGELVAGRGFWPGLCCSVKHSSVFASFTLLAKADFMHELNIPLPFSLVSNDAKADELHVFPAFWWQHNMYALARNSGKYAARDKRITKTQHIEFDTFAPDSMEEVMRAMELLEIWTAKAKYGPNYTEAELSALGRELLNGPAEDVDGLRVQGEGMEKSSRKVLIVRVRQSYQAYKDMLVYYASLNVIPYFRNNAAASVSGLASAAEGGRCCEWVNLGGQIVSAGDADALRRDIREGVLDNWSSIHGRYDELWEKYPQQKLVHSLHALRFALGTDSLGAGQWDRTVNEMIRVRKYVREAVRASRGKDFENPVRLATFRSEAESLAVQGTLEDDKFVRIADREAAEAISALESLK